MSVGDAGDELLVKMARDALDNWDADHADRYDIAAVFEAIFCREPDKAKDDPVADIFAAKGGLQPDQAARVLDILGF